MKYKWLVIGLRVVAVLALILLGLAMYGQHVVRPRIQSRLKQQADYYESNEIRRMMDEEASDYPIRETYDAESRK